VSVQNNNGGGYYRFEIATPICWNQASRRRRELAPERGDEHCAGCFEVPVGRRAMMFSSGFRAARRSTTTWNNAERAQLLARRIPSPVHCVAGAKPFMLLPRATAADPSQVPSPLSPGETKIAPL